MSLLLMLLAGCGGPRSGGDPGGLTYPAPCDGLGDEADMDGDGVLACAGDCDDDDASVWPGATEIWYDGVDQDCDGNDADQDGDGYELEEDCDDLDPRRSPHAIEVCGDEVDNDCDRMVDVACPDCDATVPGTFDSIQDAIHGASDGDVVCVAGGTWYENLTFGGAAITVVGVHGAAETIVDGGGEAVGEPVVRFEDAEGPDSVLRGFSLVNGWNDTSSGGGVRIVGAAPTLVDLIVADNSTYYAKGGEGAEGGGIAVVGGAPMLSNLLVERKWSDSGGGGIALTSSDAVLDNLRVRRNSTYREGGGISVHGGAPIFVRLNVASNYTLYGEGGGVFLLETSVRMTNVVFDQNRTWNAFGGGLYMDTSAASLTNAAFIGNISDSDKGGGEGGGLYAEAGSTVTLVNSLFLENEARSEYYGCGGEGAGAVTLIHCAFWRNYDSCNGILYPADIDGNLTLDPELLGDTLHLSATSPLVDAGHPALRDPDGSISDIGVYGGAGGASWDLDGDGWDAWWMPGPYDPLTSPGMDCDDENAAVYPGSGC